jgi:hypothetical protein
MRQGLWKQGMMPVVGAIEVDIDFLKREPGHMVMESGAQQTLKRGYYEPETGGLGWMTPARRVLAGFAPHFP